jgi:hypothetical protein
LIEVKADRRPDGVGAPIPELIIPGSMFEEGLVPVFPINIFVVTIAAGYAVECLVY